MQPVRGGLSQALLQGSVGGQSSARASPQKKKWNFGVVKTKQELREAQGMDPAGSSRGSQTLLGAAGGAAGSQLRVGFAQLSFLKEMGQELLQALGHAKPHRIPELSHRGDKH